MYKYSQYNYIIPNVNSSYILYNTFSVSVIKINQELYNLIMKNDVNYLSTDYLTNLVQQGVIIDDSYDEKNVLEFERKRSIYSNDVATFRILTTTDCNARCIYCYEQGMPTISMNYQTADACFNFISERSKSSNKIIIQWFGGEPLLNIDIMYYLTDVLYSFASQNHKQIEFTMVTNGYLLDTVDLSKLYLSKVQISLDGLEDEYLRPANKSQVPKS